MQKNVKKIRTFFYVPCEIISRFKSPVFRYQQSYFSRLCQKWEIISIINSRIVTFLNFAFDAGISGCRSFCPLAGCSATPAFRQNSLLNPTELI